MPRRRSAIIQSLVVSAFLLLLQPVTTQAQEAEPEDVWVVSIPHLTLTPGERVVGFEVRLKAAMVAVLPKIPKGWLITISNELSWNTKVSGHIEVGVAAFSKGEFFRDFLIIQKATAKTLGGAEFLTPFDIVVGLTTTVDFEDTKRVRFKQKNLLLRKK